VRFGLSGITNRHLLCVAFKPQTAPAQPGLLRMSCLSLCGDILLVQSMVCDYDNESAGIKAIWMLEVYWQAMYCQFAFIRDRCHS
jgi:hypothetical protein